MFGLGLCAVVTVDAVVGVEPTPLSSAPPCPLALHWQMYMNDHISELQPSDPVCSTSGTPGEVTYSLAVGDTKRCFSVYTPPSLLESSSSIPVLLYAHGAGVFVSECGSAAFADNQGTSWREVADKFGFAFVCVEAPQYWVDNEITGLRMSGGIWDIPSTFNGYSGNNCEAEDSAEHGCATHLHKHTHRVRE
jgi:hypothetical protein